MSCDLMVFDADKAPKCKKEFLAWYEKQTEWYEDHSYDDPAVSSPALREWFHEIRKQYPIMNGPFAATEEEWDEMEERVTDYSVGREVVYAAFAWSQAEEARGAARSLAQKHGVGFFDASGETADILLPDGTALE